MDPSMTHDLFEGGVQQAPLVRLMARCIPAILYSENPRSAQSVINFIHLLRPRLDVRRFQGVYHHVNKQYVEAMRIFGQLDGPEAQAFVALGLREIGEASWWGMAQEVYESGHPAAVAILDPWMKPNDVEVAIDVPACDPPSDPVPHSPSPRSLRA
jgi:hypothetical protein